MADPNFQFDPPTGHNDTEEFKTNPPKEAVRGYMQRLHDQTRDFINNTLMAWIKETFLTPTGDFRGTINGGDVTLTEPGLSGAFNAHKAEKATEADIGHVKVDGSTIAVDENGVISVAGGNAATVAKTAGYPDKWERIAVDNFDSIANFEFLGRDGVTDTNWTVSGNKISSTVGTNTNVIAWFKNAKLSDGTVRVVYENPDVTSASYVGLAFRRKDKSNFMAALLWDGNPGKIELWKCVNGTLTKIGDSVNFSTLDVANALNVPKSLEVEVIGVTVKIRVNNKLMITSTDASIEDNLYGECGILAFKPKISTFSNFTIVKKKFNVIHPSIAKIMCSGTSITYGVGATTPYPTLLRNKLLADFCIGALSLVNAGHSGDNTADILTFFRTEIAANLPDIVVLEGCINDTSLNVGLTAAETIKNLRLMIKLCKQYGAIPILTTSSHTDPALATATWDKTSFDKQVVNNILFTQLAAEEDIRLADVAKAFSNDFTLLADQIHPNDVGADLYAQTIYDTIAISK
jgi:lysophospholipase L1-like esterase